MSERAVVHRIEDGMDRREVEATTYQMRNFYRQFSDGFFSALDVFNYQQHHLAAKLCRPRDRVLDVCCGRGLMLPLLRFQRPELRGYWGVDLEPKNAVWAKGKRVTDGKEVDGDYYPWPTTFVEANAATMDTHPELVGKRFETIIYTASIEHMHPDAGERSLEAARALVSRKGQLLLTCPNTPADQDGYDTRYRAHVYEWKREELVAALVRSGWGLVEEWGLLMGKRELRDAMENRGLGEVFDRLADFIPSEWLCPTLSPLFPREAREIAFLCRPA